MHVNCCTHKLQYLGHSNCSTHLTRGNWKLGGLSKNVRTLKKTAQKIRFKWIIYAVNNFFHIVRKTMRIFRKEGFYVADNLYACKDDLDKCRISAFQTRHHLYLSKFRENGRACVGEFVSECANKRARATYRPIWAYVRYVLWSCTYRDTHYKRPITWLLAAANMS